MELFEYKRYVGVTNDGKKYIYIITLVLWLQFDNPNIIVHDILCYMAAHVNPHLYFFFFLKSILYVETNQKRSTSYQRQTKNYRMQNYKVQVTKSKLKTKNYYYYYYYY